MACSPRGCNCALSGPAVTGGSGQSGDPYILETGIPEVVTSLTRPATPYLAQVIYESDTGRTYLHDGSNWRIQHDPNASEVYSYDPPGSVDTTPATNATWFTASPNVVVPPWATAVQSVWTLTGMILLGSSATLYSLYPRLSGLVPAGGSAARAIDLYEPAQRKTVAIIAEWTGLTPGASLAPSIIAGSGAGAEVLRGDHAFWMNLKFDWQES